MNNNQNSISDYSVLDRPEVLDYLFHPRPEPMEPDAGSSAASLLIQTEPHVRIGAYFHMNEKSGPNILFFHGNGEIAAEYNELGSIYNGMGINFLAVDYRGYGRSSGRPTVTGMMNDSRSILDFTKSWLKDNDYSGPLIPMGRSLGSASVLELADSCKNEINGLIVESGFAYAAPLLNLLGVDSNAIGYKEETGFRNIEKIKQFNKPTLIIHAEQDHIIPFSDGQALFEASTDPNKIMLKIPNANHNDIFAHGFSEYLAAVKALIERAT